MILKPFMREGIMPLPVALISTLSRDGVRNIAPYSCIMPILRPLDLICLVSAARRDTLVNIRETKEFVVNMVGVGFSDKIVPTARYAPPEVDEFQVAGLEEKRSETIRAPGIAGSYAWMECALFKEYAEPGFVLIVGKVLRLEVADEVLNATGELDVAKARPLMMTGSRNGMHFCTLTDIGEFHPFGAMFPNGKDPLAGKYAE
ncbi:NADH-FMN oxidoreductase RutF, flavin reductase (DIM6/NTAB) family [Desulfacinum infernum DSM 9756]|uniref:NADH-FMN oxidoreductase RutF, flavin reductase (DIM6/NTAB) family n=1 Tax=Desulfacinum infernum DSM 9756 TaxID=1121391 RepID=A0A1M4ZHS7_9BACT|nr:flavin reductase family protein [Desulfacinum infernum]SHF17594.1 NADH-FMN oxidoreductase RutF, flavin reductase (DIM6/NTAB) family [Desulfacinum infernum DSM 9756]